MKTEIKKDEIMKIINNLDEKKDEDKINVVYGFLRGYLNLDK